MPRATYDKEMSPQESMHEKQREQECYIQSAKDVIKLWVGTWNLASCDPFTQKNLSIRMSMTSMTRLIGDDKIDQILDSLIPQGYEMYVLGIQEGTSRSVFTAIEQYLNRNVDTIDDDDKFVHYPLPEGMDAVYGFGDGALTSRKFTGIGVFFKRSISSRFSHVECIAHGFGIRKGSKGGVAVKMCLDKSTTFVFVSCHLEANKLRRRRKQISQLNQVFGEVLGDGRRSLSTSKNIDHIVWMGDMNYRITSLKPKAVLDLLERGDLKELTEKHDSLMEDMKHGRVFNGFKEADMREDFYPSYKKNKNHGSDDKFKTPGWTSLVYVTEYQIPFYKRIYQMKSELYSTKCPGWTDRILYHSSPNTSIWTKMIPEKVLIKPESNIWADNYCAVNNGVGMDISDHSPVFCTFLILSGADAYH